MPTCKLILTIINSNYGYALKNYVLTIVLYNIPKPTSKL
jgi:hypothetical protein